MILIIIIYKLKMNNKITVALNAALNLTPLSKKQWMHF